jgi:hypothetical protein
MRCIILLFMSFMSFLLIPVLAASGANPGKPCRNESAIALRLADTLEINRGHRLADKKLDQYKTFKSVIVNRSGFSLEIDAGTGGGGSTRFSTMKSDENDYTRTYSNIFRSQHVSASLRYNLNNFFTAIHYTREHIQPQDGHMTENVPGLRNIKHPGLTNFFPKDKSYLGIDLGYDIRRNYRLFFSPYLGAGLFSYIPGTDDKFNDMHINRFALNAGIRPYFASRRNLLFFLHFKYSRQFFQQSDIVVKDPRTYDMVIFVDDNMFHHQLSFSLGFQFKLSNRVN